MRIWESSKDLKFYSGKVCFYQCKGVKSLEEKKSKSKKFGGFLKFNENKILFQAKFANFYNL